VRVTVLRVMALASSAVLPHVVSAQPRQQVRPPGPLKVAIYRFDDSNVRNQIQIETGQNIDYGKIAADMFESPIYREARTSIAIVNRDRIEDVFKEQRLTLDDRFDESQAAKLGRLLGIDAILTGTINSLSITTKRKTIGICSIGACRRTTTVKATVDVVTRLVSAQTLQTTSFSRRMEKTTEIAGDFVTGSMSSREGTPFGAGSGSEGKNLADNYLREAIQLAVDSLAGEVLAGIRQVEPFGGRRVATAPPGSATTESGRNVTVRIIRVTPEGEVVVSRGRAAGLREGQQFEVHRAEGREIVDGRPIAITRRIGIIELTHVEADFSRAKFTADGTLKPATTDQLRAVAGGGS
jgi:curli biogenesis system outer membrane secretion channel CsgG